MTDIARWLTSYERTCIEADEERKANCLSDEVLQDYLDSPRGEGFDHILNHIGNCEDCAGRILDLSRNDDKNRAS